MIAFPVFLNLFFVRNSWTVIFVPFRNRKGVRPQGSLGFRLASDANSQTERLSEDAQSEGK